LTYFALGLYTRPPLAVRTAYLPLAVIHITRRFEFINFVEFMGTRVGAIGTITKQNNFNTSSGCCNQGKSHKSSLRKESDERK
jgi:hypothetical protein